MQAGSTYWADPTELPFSALPARTDASALAQRDMADETRPPGNRDQFADSNALSSLNLLCFMLAGRR